MRHDHVDVPDCKTFIWYQIKVRFVNLTGQKKDMARCLRLKTVYLLAVELGSLIVNRAILSLDIRVVDLVSFWTTHGEGRESQTPVNSFGCR